MKEKFEKPVMEKIAFEAEDVIVTSGGCNVVCAVQCNVICSNHEIG